MNRVDWIPVDVLSEVIVDLLLSPSPVSRSESRVFHVLNPATTTWSSLITQILRPSMTSHGNDSCKVVDFGEWVARLEASADAGDVGDANPAVKLLAFYKDVARRNASKPLPTFALDGAMRASPLLCGLQAISGAWLRRWLRQWGLEEES